MGAAASASTKVKPVSAEDEVKRQLQSKLQSGERQIAWLQKQLEAVKLHFQSCEQQNAQLQRKLQSDEQQIAQLQKQLESFTAKFKTPMFANKMTASGQRFPNWRRSCW